MRKPVSQLHQQKGFVVVMLLLILTLGISSYLLSEVQFSGLEQEREEKTNLALAQVKKILISRMFTRFDGSILTEIGTIACPDVTNNGQSTGINCEAADAGPATTLIPAIGRVPFQTLDVPRLVDGYGEVLWYAIPEMLDLNGSVPIHYPNIATNSNLLTLDGQPMAVVIISPGPALNGQSRGTALEKNNVNNYLENSNADGDYDFVSTAAGSFNDTVIGITVTEYMKMLNKFLATQVIQGLEDFFAIANGYPYAEQAIDVAGQPGEICDGNSSIIDLGGFYIGKLPRNRIAGCGYDVAEKDAFINALPAAYDITNTAPNNWSQYIWYAVGDDCIIGGACNESATTISLDGINQKYILFFGGLPQNLAGNNCGSPDINNLSNGPDAVSIIDQSTGDINNLCRYLEDGNSINKNTDADSTFFSPSGISNDFIIGVPYP